MTASSDDENPDAAGKMGFSSDGGMFFGTSPTEKKSLRRTIDKRRIDPLKDLDLNAARRDAPPKIGESVRLIDLAMDEEKFKEDESSQEEKLPVLPPFKKLDKSRKAKPGRETRAFAARAVGREFVTPAEARRNPEPAKQGSRTRRLVVNCDFKQGKMPTRSLPNKDRLKSAQTPRPPANGRGPRPNRGPNPNSQNPNPQNKGRPSSGPNNVGPRPAGPGSRVLNSGPNSGPKRGPQTRSVKSLANRRIQKPGPGPQNGQQPPRPGGPAPRPGGPRRGPNLNG